jgi:hypothetical protein
MNQKFLGGSLITFTLLFGVWAAIAAQVTGAVFTTAGDGSFVNANVYNSQFDPFLNGGPRLNAPCTAAGLPDGEYYFQVTDPSGSMLLSIFDGIEDRRVKVLGGVIVGYSGPHGTGSGKCESITVQLFPFQHTPNPGGEYKVWVTPVGSYDNVNFSGSFGFIPRYSKTDNFKVFPNAALGEDARNKPT